MLLGRRHKKTRVKDTVPDYKRGWSPLVSSPVDLVPERLLQNVRQAQLATARRHSGPLQKTRVNEIACSIFEARLCNLALDSLPHLDLRVA